MNEKNSTPACSRCGAILETDALAGLCPRCLMALNLATQTDIPEASGPNGTRIVKTPPIVPPSPEEIAAHFPQFEILECLGLGGMGVVYKARQPKLNRLVALKILAPGKENDPKFAERFSREAQVLARLNHPNIVTVYDFGETDGLYYLLMEHVDGLSLRQLMREGRMTPEEALTIVPKICEALQYAHEQGVVHRDIKPENVLVDKRGQVKIADFGIAKIMGDEGRAGSPLPAASPEDGAHGVTRPAASLTQDQVLGTPQYMAPEQREQPGTVDHRADIYSLGVVLYEMLTGELPVGKFSPPSRKVQIDVRLDEVVLRAMERTPERRYQHASQVKDDVETIAATPASGASSSVGQETVPEAPPPAVAKHLRRAAFALGVLGVVHLLAPGIIYLMAHPLDGFATPQGDFIRRWALMEPLLRLLFPENWLQSGFVSLVLHAPFWGMLLLVVAWQIRRGWNWAVAITFTLLSLLQLSLAYLTVPLGLFALAQLWRKEVRDYCAATQDAAPAPGYGSPKLRHGRFLAILSALWVAVPFLGSMLWAACEKDPGNALARAGVYLAWPATVRHTGMFLGWLAFRFLKNGRGVSGAMALTVFGMLAPLLHLFISLASHLHGSPYHPTFLAGAAITAAAGLAAWLSHRFLESRQPQSILPEPQKKPFTLSGTFNGIATLYLVVLVLSFVRFSNEVIVFVNMATGPLAKDFAQRHVHKTMPEHNTPRLLARLPGGDVELLGVSDATTNPVCWLPDGVPWCAGNWIFTGNTGPEVLSTPDSRPKGDATREILLTLRSQADGGLMEDLRIECFPTPAGKWTRMHSVACPAPGMMSVRLPSIALEGRFEIGIPAGDWEDTDASWQWTGQWSDLKKKTIRRQGTDWDITFIWSLEKTEARDFSVIYRATLNRDWDWQMVAMDADGRIHMPTHCNHDTYSNKKEGETVFCKDTFPKLSPTEVKEIRFRVRPYHRVEFDHVSLRPGHRTQPSARTLHAAAKPASQTATGLPSVPLTHPLPDPTKIRASLGNRLSTIVSRTPDTNGAGGILQSQLPSWKTIVEWREMGRKFYANSNWIYAVLYLGIAAAQSDPIAQHRLGVMCLFGQGMRTNVAMAVEWFRKAADQGQGEAQFSMGLRYLWGEGVAKDPKEAARWFHLAAAQDVDYAQSVLGQMYATGDGVERDVIESCKWFLLAKPFQEPKYVKESFKSMSRFLSEEQLAEARRRAAEFKPKRTAPATSPI